MFNFITQMQARIMDGLFVYHGCYELKFQHNYYNQVNYNNSYLVISDFTGHQLQTVFELTNSTTNSTMEHIILIFCTIIIMFYASILCVRICILELFMFVQIKAYLIIIYLFTLTLHYGMEVICMFILHLY